MRGWEGLPGGVGGCTPLCLFLLDHHSSPFSCQTGPTCVGSNIWQTEWNRARRSRRRRRERSRGMRKKRIRGRETRRRRRLQGVVGDRMKTRWWSKMEGGGVRRSRGGSVEESRNREVGEGRVELGKQEEQELESEGAGVAAGGAREAGEVE